MEAAKEQLLKNPDTDPSSDGIAQGPGQACNAYIWFIKELNNRGIEVAWRYYTDGKAWLAKGLYKWTGFRSGQKEPTVFFLSVWGGFFKVTIYSPDKVRAEVLNLPLDNEVKSTIAAAKRVGKMQVFPVVFDICSDKIFKALFLLIDLRKSLNRLGETRGIQNIR